MCADTPMFLCFSSLMWSFSFNVYLTFSVISGICTISASLAAVDACRIAAGLGTRVTLLEISNEEKRPRKACMF